MIRNLFDTFSFLGFLSGMSFGLVVLAKFPLVGLLVFVFISVLALVTLVNAIDDKIESKRNDPPTD